MPSSVKWADSTGADRYRRGLYIHYQRTTPYPQLMNFDAPGASLTCTRRERTDTPLQALNLMNDPVFFEAAQGAGVPRDARIARAFPRPPELCFRCTLGRPPGAREAERMGNYFDELQVCDQHPANGDGVISQSHRRRAAGASRGLGGVEPRAAESGRIHYEGITWTAKSSAESRRAATSSALRRTASVSPRWRS